AAANVGTETSGSILSPSNQNMLVGIKPTVGLISRHGVIPITADQDTAGPMARDVTSAAIMLNAMAGPDPLDTPAVMGPPPCPAAPVATLSDLRAFNVSNAANGAMKYLQARLDISDEMNVMTDLARYRADRAKDLNLAGTTGIDAALALGAYDALLFAGARGADIAARPGYPSV